MKSMDGYIECRETNQMIAYFRSNVNILFFKLQIFLNAVVVVKSYRNISVSLTYHIINQNYVLNDGGF